MPEYFVKGVGRHHGAANAGIQFFSQLIPLLHLLRRRLIDDQATLPHRIHRVLDLLARLGPNLNQRLIAGGASGLLHGGRHVIPRFFGDQERANDGCPVDVQHIGGRGVNLARQREVRRCWHDVDHPSLNRRQDVCSFQRNRRVAQALHDGLLLGFGTPGEKLHLLVVIGRKSGVF